MQELTMQDFKELVEKVAKLADKEGYDYETPFDGDPDYIIGLKCCLSELVFTDGKVAVYTDCVERWIEYQPRHYETLDDLAEDVWIEMSGT